MAAMVANVLPESTSRDFLPAQDEGYDSNKAELCVHKATTKAFWKMIPFASHFVLVVTTFGSMVKGYLGRHLVLKKSKADLDSRTDSILLEASSHPIPSHPPLTRPTSSHPPPSPHPSPPHHYSAQRSSDEHVEAPGEGAFSHSHSKHQFHSYASPALQKKQLPLKPQLLPTAHPQPHTHEHLQSQAPYEHRTPHSNQPVVSASSSSLLPARVQVATVSTAAAEGVLLQKLPREAKVLLQVAAQCLHAQDLNQMVQTLSDIPVSPDTDVVVALAVAFGLGQAYFKLKQLERSKAHFTKLDSLARRKRGEERGEASIANYYLGEIQSAHSQFDQAAVHYRLAINFHSSKIVVTQIYRVVAPTLSGLWAKLASALRNASKVMDAVLAYREAIAAAKAKKDMLSAHTSLGNLLQSIGDNSQAVQEYKIAIELSEELKDYISLGWAHGNLGNAYLGLFQKDQAIHHLQTSLELTLKHEPTPQAIGRAYNNLGTAYQAMNELNQAKEYYDLALSQAVYGEDLGGQARVYGNIGNLLMLQKSYERAIVHYSETLSISQDKATKTTAYHNRGCAYYERAESEKKKLLQPTATQSMGGEETESGRKSSHPPSPRPASDTESDGTKRPFSLTFHGAVADVPPEQQTPPLSRSILRLYRKAQDNLSVVVTQHEETFKHIRGSPKGLTLSVSLFETNSRTFHRLQDCCYNMDAWEEALVYAEQSRARTLGELLLERKRRQLRVALPTPLSFEKMVGVVGAQELDVVLLSYTGARLLVWVLSPAEVVGEEVEEREVRKAMFQVELEEDQFDGKSLDYYLRYSLSEVLVERNMEMYGFSDYACDDHMLPTIRLHDLFAKPFLKVMSSLHPDDPEGYVREVIVVSDSYVNLMPLAALFDKTTQEFFSNKYRFRIMPSILTMGILNQMPPVVVTVPQDNQKFCVIGNPTIPSFTHEGQQWNLGKLPFATEEAEWVSHILGCTPTLHEQATKSVVLMMISGAQLVHIATHGSATAGFLAFSNLGSVLSSEPVDHSSILIYPKDIEEMAISSALVVLSSCDSGRGVIKADGILGMARAFILAGAQAVMTTLWRVPDESGAVFMKFFYQYLMDGFTASESLQKSVLSLRSFSKYSGFIHWSGYQLTGREVSLRVVERTSEREVRERVGVGATVFPRLDLVKKLEEALVQPGRETSSPTDVQVLHGYHGLRPSGPVVDFVHKNHTHFLGGIFWLNGAVPDLMGGAVESIRVAALLRDPKLQQPALVVLDSITTLPPSDHLLRLLKLPTTRIIITTSTSLPLDALKHEIHRELIRGCSILPLQPLSAVHATQRLVHCVMSATHFTPLNREQMILEQIVELTSGSPELVEMTSALFQCCLNEAGRRSGEDFLQVFASKIPLLSETGIDLRRPASPTTGEVRRAQSTIISYTSQLISAFDLPTPDHFILHALSVFGPVPVLQSIVDILLSMVVKASQGRDGPGVGAPNPINNLLTFKLLQRYPSPVIVSSIGDRMTPASTGTPPPSAGTPLSSTGRNSGSLETEPQSCGGFCYVPQLVSDALWEKMEDEDRAFTVTTVYKALSEFEKRPSLSVMELHFAAGLTDIVVRKCERNESLNLSCYKEAYRLLVRYRTRFQSHS